MVDLTTWDGLLRSFVNNPGKVRPVSEADFLAASPSNAAYILLDLKGASGCETELRLVFLPFDWSINQRTKPP
ncbi:MULTISPECIES: hypothetical protein [unclassified Synechococcus]|uniref:hypothetical protein n=1 Tax=unclassified Synechococcus TaxID=2626047 RepID=UPI000DB3B5E5|nr:MULTISPECIES: hypothetical protein [unclassified Synechococcus]MCT0211909.1 hypothetical protein [Synechococcus sp. CS-1326]MCT0234386.1 hypothetical protein [Synechococcus sp. CS-1327]PZV04967.1 MAG: hypothetical protein DCF23_04730 [Cyanobium sp.]